MRENLNFLENKQKSMTNSKILSFYHFLKIIDFKGFAKWSVLNQTVRVNHPKGLDLVYLNKQKDS